jgi:hypothetical protein
MLVGAPLVASLDDLRNRFYCRLHFLPVLLAMGPEVDTKVGFLKRPIALPPIVIVNPG